MLNKFKPFFDLWDVDNHNVGASQSDIDLVELSLCCNLPVLLKSLLLIHDGGSFIGGEITIFSTWGNEWTLLTANEDIKRAGMFVPKNVYVFGTDGGGEFYGLYYIDKCIEPLVVMFNAYSEVELFSVHGINFEAFLRTNLSFYSFSYYPKNNDIQKGLGLSQKLIDKFVLEDVDFMDIFSFFNYPITEEPNSYAQRLTSENINNIFREYSSVKTN